MLAQTKSPAGAAVRKTIEDHYFKAQSTGDGSHLKGTFIDEGRMMWIADGQLRTRTSAEYIGGLPGEAAGRRSQPQAACRDGRCDRRCRGREGASSTFPDTKITDYFSLLKVGDDWKIVHKWFHRAAEDEVVADHQARRATVAGLSLRSRSGVTPDPPGQPLKQSALRLAAGSCDRAPRRRVARPPASPGAASRRPLTAGSR